MAHRQWKPSLHPGLNLSQLRLRGLELLDHKQVEEEKVVKEVKGEVVDMPVVVHGALHTSTSKHRKSIRKPGVLRAEMMEESESGQKPGESGVRKGNPG